MLTDELRTQTRPHHEATENIPLFRHLKSPELNRKDYLQLLDAWYRFVQPLEQQILNFPGIAEFIPDIESRMHAPMIRSDMEALNGIPGPPADINQLPPTNRLEDLLGILYVMEGSTLGAQFIIRQLKTHDWMKDDYLSFYAGYKEQTGKRWNEFKSLLNTLGGSLDQQAIIEQAKLTFNALQDYMTAFPKAVTR